MPEQVVPNLENGVTYHWRQATFNTKGFANTELTGALASCTPKAYKIYGIHIDTGNSNPNTAVTYTDDAVHMTPCSVSGLSFAYSDLVYDMLERFELYPCMVKDGVEICKLNPDNLAQKLDGTSSGISGGASGDAFLHHKECWLYLGSTGDRKISDIQQPGWIRVPEGYYPLFKGYVSGGKMRSLAGKTYTVNLTTTLDRNYATANGAGYQKLTYLQRILYETLAYIMFKSIAPFSGGRATLTGEYLNRGICWVSSPYVVFLWSEVSCDEKLCMCDGLTSSGDNFLFTKFSGPYNNGTSGYTNTGILIPDDFGGVNRYITVMRGNNSWGILPIKRDGSSSTFYAAQCDVDPGGQALVGGYGELGGIHIWDLSATGRSDSYSAISYSLEN